MSHRMTRRSFLMGTAVMFAGAGGARREGPPGDHHGEWINAIQNGGPTTCNFDYSGALAEAVLMGNVAYRLGTTIERDAPALRVANVAGAERLIQYDYRNGWRLL